MLRLSVKESSIGTKFYRIRLDLEAQSAIRLNNPQTQTSSSSTVTAPLPLADLVVGVAAALNSNAVQHVTM